MFCFSQANLVLAFIHVAQLFCGQFATLLLFKIVHSGHGWSFSILTKLNLAKNCYLQMCFFFHLAGDFFAIWIPTTISVSNVVEFLRAGLGRLRTINSELNGAN